MELCYGLLLVQLESDNLEPTRTGRVVDKAKYGVGDIDYGQRILFYRNSGTEYNGKLILPMTSVVAKLDNE
jgi:hypothetical protein